MRKIFLGLALVLVIGGGIYLNSRRNSAPLGVAFAGMREVTLWNSAAQVREPVAVNPDPRLMRHAKRRGWRIERW